MEPVRGLDFPHYTTFPVTRSHRIPERPLEERGTVQSDPGEAERVPSVEGSRAKRRSLLATGNARPVIQLKERSTAERRGFPRQRAGSKRGSRIRTSDSKPSRLNGRCLWSMPLIRQNAYVLVHKRHEP